MALKHWTGTIREPAVVWHCPSCGSEQTGALKDGCTACKAGADAKAAQQARTLTGVDERGMNLADRTSGTEPVYAACNEWLKHATPGERTLDQAFIAGATWQSLQGNSALSSVPGHDPTFDKVYETPQGGWQVAIVNPHGTAPPMDDRTHATLLAALAFYRDNQLAYGGLPGQLSAEEVTELITKLTPQEPEVPA
jgi:hypothetical protein